jgi:hypothetical protein
MRIYRDYKSRLHRSRISLTAVVFATFGGVLAKEVIRHAANGCKGIDTLATNEPGHVLVDRL